MMDLQPLVSVRIVTYNHEAYIAQCLEGVLMQRTNFPFEVIVGEHSSSDHTQEIVSAYQEKYPDQIRVLITERAARPAQNALRVHQACRGKYHAFCDGDDYWIDPLKLQKQVDLMEAHPDVSLCFHNILLVREDIFGARLFFATAMKEILTFEDVSLLTIPTSSMVARSAILDTLPEWRVNLWNGDRLVWLWCAHHGNVGYLKDMMAVYRKHAGSLSDQMRLLRKERYASTVYFCQEFDKATHYQHTEALTKLAKREQEILQQAQWGAMYYLLHPKRLVAKLKALYLGARRHRFHI